MKDTLFESALLGEKYVLRRHKSGLPMIVFPKKMSATFALFAVNYGAVDNRAGKEPFPAGVAHFLEHKLFANEDGTDSFERFSAYGADANAYTSGNKTVYVFSATSRLEESLGELLTFVTHPYFTEENVEKERGIIAEEIRMYRDDPYEKCQVGLMQGLFATPALSADICGSEASIGKITPKTLYEAYGAFYTPGNALLVVCGDVEPETVFAVADKCLPERWEAAPAARADIQEAREVHAARVRAEGQVAKPLFAIGVKDGDIPGDPAERMKKDAAVSVLMEMLFSDSGDFYADLFERGVISPDLATDYVLTANCAYQQISGEAEDPEEVFREFQKYVEKIRREGLSGEDFERARRVRYAEFIKSFDSTEEIANNIPSFFFDGVSVFGYADALLSLTREDVEKVFFDCYAPECFTLSAVYPKKEKENEI